MERRAEGPDLKLLLVLGAFLLIVLTVGCNVGLAVYFQNDVPESLKTMFAGIVGAILMLLKEVFGWVFGSSQSSARKDAIIAGTVVPPTSTPDIIDAIKQAEPLATKEVPNA